MIEELNDYEIAECYKNENKKLRNTLSDIVIKARELSHIITTCDEIETMAKEALRRTK